MDSITSQKTTQRLTAGPAFYLWFVNHNYFIESKVNFAFISAVFHLLFTNECIHLSESFEFSLTCSE